MSNYIVIVVDNDVAGMVEAASEHELHAVDRAVRLTHAACPTNASLRIWWASDLDMVFEDPQHPERKMLKHERPEVIAKVKALVDAL